MITDTVFDTKTQKNVGNWQSFVHFHPSIKILDIENRPIYFQNKAAHIETNAGLLIIYTMYDARLQINIAEYDFCDGFNTTQKAKKLLINGVADVVFMEIEPLIL